MFLSSMRNGIFSGVFLGILVLGAVGLMLSDWGSFFRDGVSRTDVAKINGKPIGAQEFDRIVRRVLNGQNIQPDVAYKAGMIDKILQQEVMARLLSKASHDYGINVSDQFAAEQIHKILEPIAGPNGDKREAWNRILQGQGMREQEMVNGLKSDIATSLLRQTIGGEIYVPQSMAKVFYQWNMEARDVAYVAIPQSFVKISAPNDSELSKFYKSIESQYTVPESRSVTVGVFNPNDLVKKADVTDEAVKKFYDDHKEDYAIDETRVLEQAVLNTEDEAKKVFEEASKSKNLEQSVVTVTSSSAAFNKASSFEQSGLTGSLATPVFAAKIGDIVGPVKSPLGWHVIAVKDIKAAGFRPYDSVKAQIKAELAHTSGSDEVFELTNQIEDRLAGGEKLEALAGDYKMKLIKLDRLVAGSTPSALSEFGADQTKILQAAFATSENEASALSELSGGKMVTVSVGQVTPAQSKPLKDVKAEVAKLWTAQETRKQFLIKALELTHKLDEKKTTLEQIAKEYGVAVKSGKLVRGSVPPAGIEKDNVAQIMNASVGKTVAIPRSDNVLLAVTRNVTLTDKSPSASELSNIEKNLALDIQEERFGSLLAHLQAKNSVSINAGLIDRLYGQQQAEQ